MTQQQPRLPVPRGMRLPTASDEDFYVALHSDPTLYAHAPHAFEADTAKLRENFADLLHRWDVDGYGYAVVVHPQTGAPAGFAGAQNVHTAAGEATDQANVYFRLAHEVHGMGLGKAAARSTVRWATEHLPTLRLTALNNEANAASIATLQRAGFTETRRGHISGEPADASRGIYWQGPTVQTCTHDDYVGMLDEVVQLWKDVNDAGGAVGFVKGASEDFVRELASDTFTADSDTLSFLAMRDTAGTLLGVAFVEHTAYREGTTDRSHTGWIRRLMVHPDHQGRGLGGVLLAAAHGELRRKGAWLAFLTYRSGHSLRTFYSLYGYVEVGRFKNVMRIPGDEAGRLRDEVIMQSDRRDHPVT